MHLKKFKKKIENQFPFSFVRKLHLPYHPGFSPLTPGTFCKNAFFGHFGAFKLDLGQISFNPVENAFATQQLAFLATSIAFYHIVTYM